MKLVQLKQANESYSLMVIDKAAGMKLLELNYDGQLTDSQVSLLTMTCATRQSRISDLLFVKEVQEKRLSEQLAHIEDAMNEARMLYESQKRLTKRETEVLAGVLRAKANKEIASDLNLSERTVKFHISSLLVKFNVRTRSELAAANRMNPQEERVVNIAT